MAAQEQALQDARELAEDLEACVLFLEQVRVGAWHFEDRVGDRRLTLGPKDVERAIVDLHRMIGFRSEELATQLRAALTKLAPRGSDTKNPSFERRGYHVVKQAPQPAAERA